jgi:SAM-dependent methyltransferase
VRLPKIFSRRFREIVRGSGDASPSDRFTVRDFGKRHYFKDSYIKLCDGLIEILDFDTVLDLGCGNGFMIEPLVNCGKKVKGVELSRDAVELIAPELRSFVSVGDILEYECSRKVDLVVCVEVAEHVPAECSVRLVEAIDAAAHRWIYFTAASPYQPGHGHINCQQQFYWLNLFRKRGIQLDWERTESFLEFVGDLRPARWLRYNSLILRKR